MEKRVRKISTDHRMHKQMVVISNDDAQLSELLKDGHRWPYIGEGRYFSKPKKVENSNYIRPWPYTRYKARGGLISDIRPWPYMRGNTVIG